MDKHAPLKKSTRRTRATAPWFNSICYQVKVKARRLEQIYLSKNKVIAYRECRLQLDIQRRVFQMAYSDYWSMVISSCATKSATKCYLVVLLRVLLRGCGES